jgi:hypothetical protein
MPRMLSRWIQAGAVAATFLCALSAEAQDCKAVADEMRRQYTQFGNGTRFTIVSGQANKIATNSSGPKVYPDYSTSTFVANQYGYGPSGWAASEMRFSDRDNALFPSGVSQNFSEKWGDPEPFDFWMAWDGSAATIWNLQWGYAIVMSQLTCVDGIMYGFGTPVGNANAGRPAMYVLSYAFEFMIE